MNAFAEWREERIALMRSGVIAPAPALPPGAPKKLHYTPRLRRLNLDAPPLVVTATGTPREQALFRAAPLFDVKWVVSESGCWLWTAATSRGNGKRRGDFRVGGSKGKVERAHRVAYELRVGPIPPGLTIDHLCFTPLCVNPAHLEPVPMAENTRRYVVKMQAEKTTCPQGHPLDGKNKAGSRFCRTCGRVRTSDYTKTHPEAHAAASRRNAERRRLRMEADPEFAAAIREKRKLASRKAYAAKKADPAKWAKHLTQQREYAARNPLTPAQLEQKRIKAAAKYAAQKICPASEQKLPADPSRAASAGDSRPVALPVRAARGGL